MVSSPTRSIPATIHEHDNYNNDSVARRGDEDDDDEEEVVSVPRSAASSSYHDPLSQATEHMNNKSTSPYFMPSYGFDDPESPWYLGQDDGLSYTSTDPHSQSTRVVKNTTPAAAAADRARAFRPTDVSSMTSAIGELSTVAPEPKQSTATTSKTSNSSTPTSIETSSRRSRPVHQQVGMCMLFHAIVGALVVASIFISQWRRNNDEPTTTHHVTHRVTHPDASSNR